MNGAIEARRGVSFGVIVFELLPAALLVALFAAVGIVHVTGRVLVVKVGYQLSKLSAERETLTREHDRLELELATEKSPARLEAFARSAGMAPPAPTSLIHVTPRSPLPRAGEGAAAKRTAGEGGTQHPSDELTATKRTAGEGGTEHPSDALTGTSGTRSSH